MTEADLKALGFLLRRSSDHAADLRRARKYLKLASPVTDDKGLVDELVDRFRGDVAVLRRAADLQIQRQHWSKAAGALKRAVELDPSHLKTRRRLARCYGQLDQWEDARLVIEPAIEHPRVIWRDYHTLASICGRLGDREEQLGYLQRAHAINPGDPEVLHELVRLLRRLGRDEEAEAAVQAARERRPRMTAMVAVEKIAALAHPDRPGFVVNIGCRDGKTWDDPCYGLFQTGYAGLAVDAGNFPELMHNLPQASVAKRLGVPVTPENVVEVLREGGTPTRFDLLHISIGCYEGVLLRPILDVFRPEVVHIAVNTEIPPPVKFSVHYHDKFVAGAKAGFWGCSVSFAAAECRPHGYVLLQLDFSDQTYRRDAMLVRHEWLQRAFGLGEEPDERRLYAEEHHTPGRFMDLGVDTRTWRAISDEEALLAEVRDACVRASTELYGKVLPFTLRI